MPRLQQPCSPRRSVGQLAVPRGEKREKALKAAAGLQHTPASRRNHRAHRALAYHLLGPELARSQLYEVVALCGSDKAREAPQDAASVAASPRHGTRALHRGRIAPRVGADRPG